jgi:hemoglobin-like flavoprotein
MTQSPAFPQAAQIERSLELLAERVGDPTPLVYARLFERQPQMKPYFWRDVNDAIKGEMLARTFDAILDFVGDRRYADHMIGTEIITHEGYDVPREVFATFFEIIRDTAREALGGEWTPDLEAAWTALLVEIDGYVRKVPRVAGQSDPFKALSETFEAGELTGR